MGIILASASPRRQELLRQVGCNFTVRISDVVEDNHQDLLPQELAVFHAKAKAVDISLKSSVDDVIIGADTIVVLDGKVYGKPIDIDDARCILTHLSGKEHQVITGIAVVKAGKAWTDFVVTTVKFGNLTSETIEKYLATGEPLDKAGAYGIQGIGVLLVEEIKGCYNNVVGLPLYKLSDVLMKAGVPLL
ncbi:Maf family protein [Pelosinus sp. sgz500959]|uniref:Maf family protein n=1 Tax=Pelosinus sp. sgz500959 TaxID=3242472 RepID=UPI00367303A2